MLTVPDCKSMIFKAGIECGVSPNLISENLLSKEDKEDMMNGKLSLDDLREHTKVWKEKGCFAMNYLTI